MRYYIESMPHIKNVSFALWVGAVFSMSTVALAETKQDCVLAGKVFQDAMQSRVMEIAYGERVDWRRIDFYMLPKAMQERVDNDVANMRVTAESIVANVAQEVEGWKRQGMDGEAMARQILLQGQQGLGERYAIACLQQTQAIEARPLKK